jgi:hypothetical protein
VALPAIAAQRGPGAASGQGRPVTIRPAVCDRP